MSDLISKRELYRKLGEVYIKGYLSWGANEVIKDIIGECDFVENKGEWIPFSKELPPKDKKVHVSTFGIVTIGERTSEANEALRLSILEPMNNLYKNIDPKQYQITHWQPLPKGYER